MDFPELCALFGLKEIPDVRPVTAASPTERALGKKTSSCYLCVMCEAEKTLFFTVTIMIRAL